MKVEHNEHLDVFGAPEKKKYNAGNWSIGERTALETAIKKYGLSNI